MDRSILIVGISFLFVLSLITPVTPGSDNKTKNVTVILDGKIGENEWFVSCVNITFDYNPEEVELIYYNIDNGNWSTYYEMFQVCEDGYHKIMWYYIDLNGNNSEVEELDFKIDKTAPCIILSYYIINEGNDTILIEFTATAIDDTSGMNKVEFYNNYELQKTVYGAGPTYTWETTIDIDYFVFGFIFNIKITDEYIKFFAIVVNTCLLDNFSNSNFKTYAYDNAGNSAEDMIHSPGQPYYSTVYFRRFTFINDYEGYIGRFFIIATFEFKPIEV